MIANIKSFLLVGADSNLGINFYKELCKIKGLIISGTSNKKDSEFKYFDLREQEYTFAEPSERGKALIFASKPNHKFCEEFPAEAHEINVVNTLRLIDYLNSIGWETVVFSSAQVFSGKSAFMRISDVPDPISTYGKQKVELENLLQHHKKNIIIRVPKILNLYSDPFNTWIINLRKSEVIKPFINYPISPISIPSLFKGSINIMADFENGIWHLGNREQSDYYSLAKLIAHHNNLDTSLVQFSNPREFKMEHYPKFASLDVSQTEIETSWRAENLIEAVKNSKLFKI